MRLNVKFNCKKFLQQLKLVEGRNLEKVQMRAVTMVSGLQGATYKQCCGSGMFIPDPGSEFFTFRIPDPIFFHPGSRIRIKEFKYFNPKKWFLSSRKYDLGCSSGS
jgi:hypothetical protein